jgi:hypothetical protein
VRSQYDLKIRMRKGSSTPWKCVAPGGPLIHFSQKEGGRCLRVFCSDNASAPQLIGRKKP